ncbi:MAG: glycosyltransferase family 2 protein [Pontiella sp.]|nr:glycosyltransferase family 2 protein [Pontiella sp.]
MSESVAIIMRAKNEMPQVRQTLDMLRKQTFTGFDFFAVDSGSTDGTLEVLQENYSEIVPIPPDEYVPGKVLNDAIGRINHPVIVLLNADAIPLSNDWLEKLITPVREGSVDATFCKQTARPDARFIVAYDYERAYNPSKISSGFFSAVACAFRRELWQAHRFPEQGYAEDAAWARACIEDGARIQLVEDSVVEHSHNYTLEELYRKRFRQAPALGAKPTIGKLMRELLRDLLHAAAKLRVHTIPYNIAYRITIHRAVYRGLRPQ